MSNLRWKQAIAHFWPAKRQSSRKIILLYHSVGATEWGMSEKSFSQQMSWLADHCFVLPLTELIHAKPSREIQVAITFDDGYKTLHDYAAPILADKKIEAMVYINTGWIDEDERQNRLSQAVLGHYPNEYFLNWREVKALHQSGWEIGSHGVNHYNFADAEESVALQELIHSKKTIEEYLYTNCLHFAYPWGRYSNKLKEIVRSVGYQYAAAAQHGVINQYLDPLAFPRINISNDYTFEDFKNIIWGKWDYLGWIQRMKGL